MRVRPLTGQVLVEILPAEKRSPGGIDLPEHTPSPEENQEAARRPAMPPGLVGTVLEVGNWPKAKNGLRRMPEFHRGCKVIIGHHSGLDLSRGLGPRFKILHWEQVLAVLK